MVYNKNSLQNSMSQIKENLSKAMGNLTGVINILKHISESDTVDLLFYDEEESYFFDKIGRNTIPKRFLDRGTISIIGQAYKHRVPYRSYHIRYDPHYNISIDNPFKVDISSQIIIPIINNHKILGMVRFTKYKYTFSENMLNKLIELDSNYQDIFSSTVHDKITKFNNTFFSIDANEIYTKIDTIKKEIQELSTYAHNPEIKKIIMKAENSIELICDYIRFDVKTSEIEEEEKVESPNLRILLADDVQMNVKILHAMLKGDSSWDISFAYDGIEALQKISEGHKNDNTIDVLYLDHYMPGKLGLEVAETIRKYEKNSGKKMIIISITNDPTAIESRKELYDYHLAKPFTKTDIVSVMEEIQKTK